MGSTAGNLIGYVACGVIPSIGILAINEPLGLYLLQQVGEEALDEFLGNIRILLRTSLYGLVQSAWITLFKNTRRTAKIATKNPNSPVAKLGRRIFGKNFDTAIEKWGEEGSKPWSFAIEKERRRDEIKDPLQREFWEEFDDEFGDACRDASYVIADGIDAWSTQQRMQQESRNGSQQTIEFIPNREAPDERILVSGSEQEVRTQLMTTMATHEMIGNRDVGMWVGEPLRHDARRKPSPLTLRIQLFNWPSPPFFRTNDILQRVTITIPGIKKSRLDWQRIKETAGGNTGYMWGRFSAVAKLKNDQDEFTGQMQVYGGSESEAERRLKACLELSDYSIQTLTITEERREGIRATNRQQYKRSIRVYPAYCTLINSQKIQREDEGDVTLQGTYRRRRDKILLWVNDKPTDFETIINRLTSNIPN